MPSPTESTPEQSSDVPTWSNDPKNPQNWILAKRIYNTLVPSLLCFTISFGLAIYSPSHVDVQGYFHTSTTLSLLPFTLYVYGLALGPTISAPLSETYGRRFSYFFLTPISLLFILGAGFAKNMGTLLVCRFFAGTFGSSPLAVGAGSIMDIWRGRHSAIAMTLFFLTAFLGPVIGSLVGGWVAQYKGWRWSQWTTLCLGGSVWIMALGTKETYASLLVRQRAKRLGLPLPPHPIPTGAAGLKQLVTVTLTRPLVMLATEPIVGLCSLYTAFNFAVLFCFLAAFPMIYQTTYGFTPGQSGLVFLGVAVGCVVGGVVSILIGEAALAKKDASCPERWLWGALFGGPIMPAALFWFAWTARPGVHWIVSIIAAGFFGCSNICIFVSCVLYLTNVYGEQYGASALAANGVLRYILGGSFPLLGLPMYHNLGFSWAGSLLGFLAAGLAPIPWVFYQRGERIRSSSRYTLHFKSRVKGNFPQEWQAGAAVLTSRFP